MKMASKGSVESRVKEFVAAELRVSANRLSASTRLASDLGLAGDDADEFFENFSREFAIDPKSYENLHLPREFGNEGVPLWLALPESVGILAFGGTYFITGRHLLSLGIAMLLSVSLAIFCCRRFPNPKRRQHEMTIDELVRTAQQKSWMSTFRRDCEEWAQDER